MLYDGIVKIIGFNKTVMMLKVLNEIYELYRELIIHNQERLYS